MERDSLFRELQHHRLERETATISNPDKGQVLLVAGFQYENPREDNVVYCKHRMDYLWRKRPNLLCSIFDVARGLLIQKSGKKGTWTTVKTFSPVTLANNYTGKLFHKNTAGVISITDVYDFIIEIGKTNPGSLVEFSVFSHGWFEGPILVNSNDTSSGPLRDPDDKDGRSLKDFSPSNMTPARLSHFQSAFAPDGISWMWGCNFANIYRQVLHRITKTSGWRSKTKDTAVFSFSFSQDFATNFYADDSLFFPSSTSTLSFSRSVKEIKDFFNRGISDCYCKRLAVASLKPCYGGLLGTYAEPRKAGRLWVIPTSKPPQSANFSSYIKFYALFMGMKTDPEKRNYGIYR